MPSITFDWYAVISPVDLDFKGHELLQGNIAKQLGCCHDQATTDSLPHARLNLGSLVVTQATSQGDNAPHGPQAATGSCELH